MTRGSARAAADETKTESLAMSSRIKAELHPDRISAFEAMVDRTYELAFIDKFTDFSAPRSNLTTNSAIARIYARMYAFE